MKSLCIDVIRKKVTADMMKAVTELKGAENKEMRDIVKSVIYSACTKTTEEILRRFAENLKSKEI